MSPFVPDETSRASIRGGGVHGCTWGGYEKPASYPKFKDIDLNFKQKPEGGQDMKKPQFRLLEFDCEYIQIGSSWACIFPELDVFGVGETKEAAKEIAGENLTCKLSDLKNRGKIVGKIMKKTKAEQFVEKKDDAIEWSGVVKEAREAVNDGRPFLKVDNNDFVSGFSCLYVGNNGGLVMSDQAHVGLSSEAEGIAVEDIPKIIQWLTETFLEEA